MFVSVFFITKCVLAYIGTLLLVFHMGQHWENVVLTGQRMRYLTLFGFAVATSSGSTRQVVDHFTEIHLENVLGFIVINFLIATIIMSNREAKHGRVREHY